MLGLQAFTLVMVFAVLNVPTITTSVVPVVPGVGAKLNVFVDVVLCACGVKMLFTPGVFVVWVITGTTELEVSPSKAEVALRTTEPGLLGGAV